MKSLLAILLLAGIGSAQAPTLPDDLCTVWPGGIFPIPSCPPNTWRDWNCTADTHAWYNDARWDLADEACQALEELREEFYTGAIDFVTFIVNEREHHAFVTQQFEALYGLLQLRLALCCKPWVEFPLDFPPAWFSLGLVLGLEK